MESAATQAPPEPPELPEGAEAAPRWPAWYAAAAFLVGVFATFMAVGVVAAVTGTTSGNESPAFTIIATLLQGAIFAGTAVLFASFTDRPRPWHFGLRRTRLWPAVGWAALGILSFYVFAAAYSAVLHPDAKQSITESLGADEGVVGLIAAGVMVIAVAPAAEEFFFRGFFYRALRSRFRVIPAALIDGTLFGVIHYDFSGADLLLILPPLAVLGFVFCLVYEQTGSIYPTIALHSLNNAIAYGVQADAWGVSLVVGPLVLAACMFVPRLLGPPPRAAPAV
ncbi:MAG TPA: type II CAAX endopeptidase family protein [Thermoleophilaceae bacterium]|nr:type II CAAX endopeptidase family protein [Thermoleophilaceae bacterium]